MEQQIQADPNSEEGRTIVDCLSEGSQKAKRIGRGDER